MSPVLGMGSSKGCTHWTWLKAKVLCEFHHQNNTKQKPGLSCSSPDEMRAGCHRRQSFSSVSILRSNGIGDHKLSVTPHPSLWQCILLTRGLGMFHSLYVAATTEDLRLSDKQKFICLTELKARRPRWRDCIYSLILRKVYWAIQRLQGQMWHVFTLATPNWKGNIT